MDIEAGQQMAQCQYSVIRQSTWPITGQTGNEQAQLITELKTLVEKR